MREMVFKISLVLAMFATNAAFATVGDITQDEIDQVYSNKTETFMTGGEVPVSTKPMIDIFTDEDIPSDFAPGLVSDEISFGGEMVGYLNLGDSPDEKSDSLLISSFENVNAWTGIKDPDNVKVFSNAYTVDKRNKKVADIIDGRATQMGDEQAISLFVKATAGIKIRIDGKTIISNDPNTGIVSIEFINTKNVKAIFVGTVIKAGNIRFRLDFEPYKNGWLVYGASAAKLEKFEKDFDKDFTGKLITNFFEWIQDSVTVL